MSSESQILQMLTQLLTAFPILLTCLIGMVVISRQQLGRSTKRAGIVGLAALLIDSLVSLAFNIFFSSTLFRDMALDSDSMMWIFRANSLFGLLLYLVGLICLIIAVCAKENPRVEHQAPDNPYASQ
jgi:hypothetical protein